MQGGSCARHQKPVFLSGVRIVGGLFPGACVPRLAEVAAAAVVRVPGGVGSELLLSPGLLLLAAALLLLLLFLLQLVIVLGHNNFVHRLTPLWKRHSAFEQQKFNY